MHVASSNSVSFYWIMKWLGISKLANVFFHVSDTVSCLSLRRMRLLSLWMTPSSISPLLTLKRWWDSPTSIRGSSRLSVMHCSKWKTWGLPRSESNTYTNTWVIYGTSWLIQVSVEGSLFASRLHRMSTRIYLCLHLSRTSGRWSFWRGEAHQARCCTGPWQAAGMGVTTISTAFTSSWNSCRETRRSWLMTPCCPNWTTNSPQ